MTDAQQAAYDAFISTAETARDAGSYGPAFRAYLNGADVALGAADTASELLALRRAMTMSETLPTVNQQDGNSMDYASSRQAIQARIDRLQQQAVAVTGIQRQKVIYIAPTS